jgi:hypothetical protein
VEVNSKPRKKLNEIVFSQKSFVSQIYLKTFLLISVRKSIANNSSFLCRFHYTYKRNMGVMFSCSETPQDAFESLLMKSLSIEENSKSEPSIIKTFGSGKLIIRTSLSFKKEEDDSLQLEAKISISSPKWRESSPRVTTCSKSRFTYLNNTKDELQEAGVDSPKHDAAIKLQKVYKSFRTRRQLADCAVLAEQRWYEHFESVYISIF